MVVNGAKGSGREEAETCTAASCLVSLRTSMYFRFASQKAKEKANVLAATKVKNATSAKYFMAVAHTLSRHSHMIVDGRGMLVGDGWQCLEACLFICISPKQFFLGVEWERFLDRSQQRKAQHKYAYQIFR